MAAVLCDLVEAMNERIKEFAEQAGFAVYGWNENEFEKFAALVAAQEREAWEHKFARVQNLMDVREIQPNKPCCLAARADERRFIAEKWENWYGYDKEGVAEFIRKRANTQEEET